MTTALILTSSLSLVLAATCIILVRAVSRMSTRATPTPSTTPVGPDLSQMMTTTMAEISSLAGSALQEMRSLTTELVLGRQSPPPTTETVTPLMPSARTADSVNDYDNTPLAAGIEAILAREAEETEQDRSLRERSELQRRTAEILDQWNQLDNQDLGDFSPAHFEREQQDRSPT